MDALWAELINSDWHDHRGGGGREDRIENRMWLSQFMIRCGVVSRPLSGRAGREALWRLREVARRAAVALMAAEAPGRRDLEAINRCLADAPFTHGVTAGGRRFALESVPYAGGVTRALGEAGAWFAELPATGGPTRVKVCANRDCGWFVYDSSGNRTRRWCEPTGCGSLIKVRRYRRRHRRTTHACRTHS